MTVATTHRDVVLDTTREDRIGFGEAVLAGTKSVEQLITVLDQADDEGLALLLTRLEPDQFDGLPAHFRDRLDYEPTSCTAYFGAAGELRGPARVAVVTAGTSDATVARQAVRTLAFHGIGTVEISDVGVAGLWRLQQRIDEIAALPVVIAVAGMDAALPTVLGGLVPSLVIAVPTSVGYGIAERGKTALHALLASCAPGLVTVNIDNGYGAACAAMRALRVEGCAMPEVTAVLQRLGDVAVAVSGGVDSMTLAVVAHRTPGVRAEMFHAVSAAVPPEATERVHRYAAHEDWKLRIIDAQEFADPDYLRNPVTRCFHCKSNLYGTIAALTHAHIVSGTNTDDLADYRPGLAAASARNVHHPYVDAGVDKAGVRRIAHTLGLDDLAELPAAPCLSSRIETSLAIDPSVLRLVNEVERHLTATIAPKAVRCRVRADRVVVELDEATLHRLDVADRHRIVTDVANRWRRGGHSRHVDLAPYRRGSAFLHTIQHTTQQEVTPLTAATDTQAAVSTSNLRFDFTGRTVIITGAGKGIGRSLAEAFAGANAEVVLVGRTADALEEAATATGATPVVADVAKTEDAERVVAETMARTGRIDVLVNNAGFLRDSVLWKMDDDAWNDVVDVHLGGTFRLIRACAPHFRAQKYGRIINMTSYSGLHGNLGQANYSAAKAGIIGLTKTAAKELGRSGVTVNAVLPFADTGMTASIPEDRKAALVASVPLGRVAAAEEMAAAVAFLASAEASYVTGTVIQVDGGISM